MLLNQTQKYALKIIYHLAIHHGKSFSATKLNTELQIPYKYLTHILTKLSKAQLLGVCRGRDGGFKFEKDAKEVFLFDVVKAVSDEGMSQNQCILNASFCNCQEPCFLHSKWAHIRKEIETMLSYTSVADLDLKMVD